MGPRPRSPRARYGPLWKVSVAFRLNGRNPSPSGSRRERALRSSPPRPAAGADNAISKLLSHAFSTPASSFTDLTTGTTTVSVFLPTKPVGFAGLRASLNRVLRRLKERGLITATARISQTRLRPRDWAEAWKSHFKPINIAGRLRVKPSWSRQPPRTGQKVVALDPGLSFGTGHHPTTRFCLEQIVARMNPTGGNSFLDIGTGSGILAIAAARLGYSPVRAFDNDPSAVRIARANARRNRLLDAISFAHADVASVPLPPRRRYSLVCANLSSPLLIQQRKRIASTVMPGGMLVLAGILASEFDRVERAFARLGFHRIAARTDSEWRSGAFQMEPS